MGDPGFPTIVFKSGPGEVSDDSDDKPESVKSELMMIEFNYKTKSEALKAKNLRRKRRQAA